MVTVAEPLLRVLLVIAATCTWYGPQNTDGDPFVAAYWHNELPDGAPAIVDYEYLGVATASRDIPFGTKIRFTIIGLPKWAREEYKYLEGRSVVATVVDRIGDENGEVDFDLWPATFLALVDNLDVGVLYVKAEILEFDRFDKIGISYYNYDRIKGNVKLGVR